MTENIYAPPKSNLSIVNESAQATEFYVVSKRKFATLYVATLGMYSLYWFYKNWSLYRSSSNEKLWPIPRAIFSYFFVHSLFRRIQSRLTREKLAVKWNPEAQATVLAVLIFLSSGLDRAASKSFGSPYTDALSFVILIPLFLSFSKAQAVINIACHDPDGIGNSRLTRINYFWIAVVPVVLALIFVGAFMGALS